MTHQSSQRQRLIIIISSASATESGGCYALAFDAAELKRRIPNVVEDREGGLPTSSTPLARGEGRDLGGELRGRGVAAGDDEEPAGPEERRDGLEVRSAVALLASIVRRACLWLLATCTRALAAAESTATWTATAESAGAGTRSASGASALLESPAEPQIQP